MPCHARLSALVVAATLGLAFACGGTLTVLHAKGHTGSDGAHVDVLNSSGVPIEKLHIAKTETVDRARSAGVTPDSPEDDALWGNDELGNAGLVEGHTFKDLTLPEGRYDVLVVDHDHREQLVKHLSLHAGRKYILEIGTAWTQAR
jgi:hypothetical protein